MSTPRPGTLHCQKCLKYGHFNYECTNERAYRYRPSRTVMFKQNIKLQLNKDKGPLTKTIDRDRRGIRVEDRPSTDEEPEQLASDAIQAAGTTKVETQRTAGVNHGTIELAPEDEDDDSSSSEDSSSDSSKSESHSSQQKGSKKVKLI